MNFNRLHNQWYRNRHGELTNARTVSGYALVPMVPADVSYGGYRPEQLHILWEVDAWSDKSLLAQPPFDPYLLRRVRGELFEVLAEWDLTEVERYVMQGRARLQG